MIAFFAHKESLFTATIEWWPEAETYHVSVFYPNEVGIAVPSLHCSLKDAIEAATYVMTKMHERFGKLDNPGEDDLYKHDYTLPNDVGGEEG